MRKMLLASAALAVALAASAQEPKFDFRRDSTRTSGFTLPASRFAGAHVAVETRLQDDGPG